MGSTGILRLKYNISQEFWISNEYCKSDFAY